MQTKRFDATLKHLQEHYPRDLPMYFARFLGLPLPGRIELIDADLSTVTAASDKVYHIHGRRPWLFHLEVQASHDNRLAGSCCCIMCC